MVELTGPNDGSHMAGRRAANKMCPNLTFFNQSRAVITLIEYIFAFTLHKKKCSCKYSKIKFKSG